MRVKTTPIPGGSLCTRTTLPTPGEPALIVTKKSPSSIASPPGNGSAPSGSAIWRLAPLRETEYSAP